MPDIERCTVSVAKRVCDEFRSVYKRIRTINVIPFSGYLLWGSDLRTDDNPIEAGLGFTCRETGEYLGKPAVDRLRKIGIKRRLVHVRLNEYVS